MSNPKIVVVGGGYGGVFICTQLENRGYDVVLVERNECFFHKIGGAKACIVPGYEKQVVISYDNFLTRKGSRVVRATVEKVDMDNNQLVIHTPLNDETHLAFDYLVIATGLRHGFGQLPDEPMSKEDMLGYLQSEQERIRDSSSYTVVGGGALGVETSAQLRSTFPDKETTLYHSKEKLLSAATPPVSDAFSRYLIQKMSTLDVNCKLGGGRIDEEELKADGKRMKGDLLLYTSGCRGSLKNSDLLESKYMQENGEIKVNASMQLLHGPPNIFAIGDVAATRDYKQARWAHAHAMVVVDNISRLQDGVVKLKLYSPVQDLNQPILYKILSRVAFFWVKKRVSKSKAVVALWIGDKDSIAEFYGVLWNKRFTRRFLRSDKGAKAIQKLLKDNGPF